MLGEVVKDLREEHGWGRPYLATESGVSLATINRLELHEIVPNHELMSRIAAALGTTPGALLIEAERRIAEEAVPPVHHNGGRSRAPARK